MSKVIEIGNEELVRRTVAISRRESLGGLVKVSGRVLVGVCQRRL